MITSFYSFKGGVGRTLAVVHVARRLARALARDEAGDVLVVDLDLEAPGLDPYLRGEVERCGGLARLLGRLRGKAPSERAAWLRKALQDRRYVVEHPRLPLRYLPSGLGFLRDDGAPGYSAVAAWLREILDEPDGGVLADLRDALRAAATYVLIGSRTGLADESYLSTVLLPDALVLLFRPSALHLIGVERVYRNFLERRGIEPGEPRAPVIPVVSPLPNRGGTDIAEVLQREVPRVFRWSWEEEPDDDTRFEAPLERVDPRRLVRLYEEPCVELGETTLVDEDGEWLPGFDRDTPLPQGYERLVKRLRYLNFRADWRGADWLARYWDREGHDALAGRFLVERLRQRFDVTTEPLKNYALGREAWLEVVGPGLEAVRAAGGPAHVAAALAMVGAMHVADTEVEGAELRQALGWAEAGAAAPEADRAFVATVQIWNLAMRFQAGVPPELAETIADAVDRGAPILNMLSEDSDQALHGILASLQWSLARPEHAARHLAHIPRGALGADAAGALGHSLLAAVSLGNTALFLRVAALCTIDGSAELCGAAGWTNWSSRLPAQAGQVHPSELRALLVDVTEPHALAPLPQPGDTWRSALLRGGLPAGVPPQVLASPAGRFMMALREPGPAERPLPAMDRGEVGWQFASEWLRGAESLASLAVPPNVKEPVGLNLALFDTLRMALFGAAIENEVLVTEAVSLMNQIITVAPGLGALVRRLDGGRAPLLAAYHLERQGRLSTVSRELVARVRAPLFADVPPPEPPLDDLSHGYEVDVDRLMAAAALVGELPRRLFDLSERVRAAPLRS